MRLKMYDEAAKTRLNDDEIKCYASYINKAKEKGALKFFKILRNTSYAQMPFESMITDEREFNGYFIDSLKNNNINLLTEVLDLDRIQLSKMELNKPGKIWVKIRSFKDAIIKQIFIQENDLELPKSIGGFLLLIWQLYLFR